ncbi:hypothetical protein TL16_g07920 [Triparma laevis f. inornata]|uniref:Uncharacterized protein n=1 Tax=Triparma laevis f. inornata TaxID=1714386 RepID=A0A9W7EH56_9STRA|nr:hypothetical protein TL16_g07920 [Triparma laevis f. inornata]
MSGLLAVNSTTIYYRYPSTASPKSLVFPTPNLVPLWSLITQITLNEGLTSGLDFTLTIRNASTSEMYVVGSSVPNEDLQPSTEIRRFAEEEVSSEDDEEALSKLFSQAKQSRHGSGTLGSKVGRRMNVKRNTVGQAYKPKQSVPRTEDATEEEENKGVRGMPLSFIQSISATTKSGNVVEKQIVQSNLLIGKDEKGLTDMLHDLDIEVEPNVVCPLCNLVLENPTSLPWDSEMRSVCLDCIISRCNDFNNFKCPLTGVEGVNVAGLKGSGFERERVKNYVEGIKSEWKQWRLEKGLNLKRKRVEEMRGRMLEDEEDFEEENEFEDMKVYKEDEEDEFGGDVFGEEEKKEEEVKEIKITKTSTTGSEATIKAAAAPNLNLNIKTGGGYTNLTSSDLPLAKLGPQNATYQLTSLKTDPVHSLPSGYAIGPGGMVGQDIQGYFNNTGVGEGNVSGRAFRPVLPMSVREVEEFQRGGEVRHYRISEGGGRFRYSSSEGEEGEEERDLNRVSAGGGTSVEGVRLSKGSGEEGTFKEAEECSRSK